MGRVRRGDVGGRVYHALNRTDFRSRLFKQEVEKVPGTCEEMRLENRGVGISRDAR